MAWFEYRRFPAEQDLALVSALLHQRRVAHRFTEEGNEQVLWLNEQEHVPALDEFFSAWLKGDIKIERAQAETPHNHRATSLLPSLDLAALMRLPLTTGFIILGCLGYFFVDVLQSRAFFSALAFAPLHSIEQSHEYWRVVSPAFFHFSPVHIIMNAMWLWVLGQKIEPALAKSNYLLLFLVTAISGNVLQYQLVQSIYFGGLSGVVYGYLGFIAVAYWLFGRREVMVQPGIIIFSVVFMALGFWGALDWLSDGGIANWAHLGGFISGCLYAVVYYSIFRQGSKHVK